MLSYRYLIVGGGMTADAACKGIRECDAEGTIGLVGAESHPPYKRPPLTKGLWAGAEENSIWRGTEEARVDLRLGRRIVALDLEKRRAVDDRGDEYAYERLLLATGGRPRTVPDWGDDVVYFRTLDDYRDVRARARAGARFVVIGGGFIGSEIAASLTSSGCAVTMVFPEPGIGWRVFAAELAAFVTDDYRSRGVEVLAGASVDGVEREGGVTRVRLGEGRVLEADAVVAGLGIEPNVELATAAGLPVDGGIVVDEYGRVGGREEIFAAGDVARFPVPALGESTRVEHEDHANTHGRRVGANMAGAEQTYDHLPFFYSDLFDLGYEAVGAVDSRSATLARWTEPGKKGVVAYLDGAGRPRGFLLWGIFGRVDAARELIRVGEPIEEDALAALVG
ncbi:Pyridine nucleotide-disulfide oxidoreductase [Gaiella occulta]|uniref:Pyridine nucleotide-disulfide oxidoreductase n=1 Tax=Gaiella occulta TaxID=1002870 RepID=A0A7M2Z1K5_9ACTN|nr:FAD-dependent oxidoreductase [Gaiella occulta]RDI76227.1 Pyridine nucleotide-disulfide oxidoreductase [Gaiella occulta]